MDLKSIKRIQKLLKKINKIDSLDVDRNLFNSEKYYEKKGSISFEDLNNFEKLYKVSLPSDYKSFLALGGNGFFGILPLEKVPNGRNYPHNNFSSLGIEFPFSKDWNFMDFEEFKERYSKSNQFVLEKIDLKKFKKKYQSITAKIEFQNDIFGEKTIIENEQFLKSLYSEIYFSEDHLNGAIHLFDYGCAIRAILIISGKQKGKVWIDDRANRNGIYQELNSKGKPLEFFEWIDSWTNELLFKLKKKSAPNNA